PSPSPASTTAAATAASGATRVWGPTLSTTTAAATSAATASATLAAKLGCDERPLHSVEARFLRAARGAERSTLRVGHGDLHVARRGFQVIINRGASRRVL